MQSVVRARRVDRKLSVIFLEIWAQMTWTAEMQLKQHFRFFFFFIKKNCFDLLWFDGFVFSK